MVDNPAENALSCDNQIEDALGRPIYTVQIAVPVYGTPVYLNMLRIPVSLSGKCFLNKNLTIIFLNSEADDYQFLVI